MVSFFRGLDKLGWFLVTATVIEAAGVVAILGFAAFGWWR